MHSSLPPGPRMPAALQTIGWWSRPTAFLERCRSRYGKRFTVRLLAQSPIVMISDADEIRELFQAPPDVLHPGEGAYILEPVVGPNSVILLDEDAHLEQRKLMLPAFHGEKMQALSGLMAELAEREVGSWRLNEPVVLAPRLQRVTLEIILRAVFGLEQGAQLESLREVLTELLAFADSPLSLLPPAQRLFAGRGPIARHDRIKAHADRIIYAVIDERRQAGSGGEDVLAMLLEARHSDGSPMTPEELRDELMTALVAGHETTASQLGWAIDRIAREPAVQQRLHAELDSDGEDAAYLDATIHEILRHRAVIPNAEPRLVKKPIEIGGFTYEPGTVLFASAYLVHHDPDVYPDPYAFRPERFLGKQPGTYTWIPFGGGRRRCLGASFALLEMKLVLRALLERCSLSTAGNAPPPKRRGITIRPPGDNTVVLSARAAEHAAQADPAHRTAALA